MNPRLHERATDIFLEVCDLPPADRAAAIDASCGGDAELRQEVISLLAHDDSPAGPGEPGGEAAEPGEIEGGNSRSLIPGVHPRRVGSYSILQPLGEGGMATVFLAEPEVGGGGRVAIKMIRPGLDTGEVLARFGAEREALSLLDHPAIAKVLDAGTTESGRPYFAMEYVAGIPITAYCDKHRLPTRERLALFAQVCEAVHYAHTKGIIHRDLKPSNVLVVLEGDEPRPKIIDFGVARATKPDLAVHPLLTLQGTLLGTPAYMSPEQAEMSALDIDARTDVYSLGALLYELITGVLPLDWDPLRHASLDGIRSAIRESDPVPPSVRVRELGERAGTLARHMRTDPGTLEKALRGPLDRIVAVALDKDRTRRYATASELGADVQRFLRGEPVVAGRRGLRDRWARRLHGRGMRIAMAAVVLAALAGVVSWALRPRQAPAVGLSADELARARREAEWIQFKVERTDPDSQLVAAAGLERAAAELPEATLVLAQAQIRSAKVMRREDLEREARGLLLNREADTNTPGTAALRALFLEIERGTDAEEVERIRTRAARDTPRSAEDWYLLSFATLDLPTALSRAETAARLDPGNTLVLARRAHLYETLGRYDEALESAGKLIALGVEDYRDHDWELFRACVKLERGQPREALEILDAVQGADRLLLPRAAARSAAQMCLGEYESAVKALSEGISAHSGNAFLRYRRATALWILGLLDEAATDYLEFRKRDRVAFFADARLYFLHHDKARARERLGDALGAEAIRRLAGEDLAGRRQIVSKGSWIDKILECAAGERTPEDLVASADPKNPEQVCESFYYAGESCLRRGKTAEARRWFEKCVATGLVFDPTTFPPAAMNEFFLARFRVAQLAGEALPPGPLMSMSTGLPPQ